MLMLFRLYNSINISVLVLQKQFKSMGRVLAENFNVGFGFNVWFS